MDIRKYLSCDKPENKKQKIQTLSEPESVPYTEFSDHAEITYPVNDRIEESTTQENTNENMYDTGAHINVSSIPFDLKLKILLNTTVPKKEYNFKKDSTGKRAFRFPWIEEYSLWLCYLIIKKVHFANIVSFYHQRFIDVFKGHL